MKLPAQAAAVLRHGHSWPARPPSSFGTFASSNGHPNWMGCPGCENPCKTFGAQHNKVLYLVECPESGTKNCCPGANMYECGDGGGCQCA